MNPLGTLKKFKQKDRYGNSLEYEFNVPEMQDQIPLPYQDAIGNRTNLRAYDHPGEPKGLDTVPAWLTPGEAVIPQEAVEAEPQLVEDLINKGRSIQEQERGVPVPRLNSGSFVGSPEYFDSLMFKGKLSPAAIPQMSDEPSMGDLATQLVVNSATGEVEEKLIDPMVKGVSSYIPSFFNSGGVQISPTKANIEEELRVLSGIHGGNTEGIVQGLMSNLGIGREQALQIATMHMNDGGVVYANIGLVDFLKGAEDFRGEAYRDGDGWSIGYGSSGAKEGDTITEEEALARLNKDLGWVNQSYDNSVTNKDLNMNQANAVKSLIYNIGAPNWEKSKAKEALNAGDLEGFEREMREFRMSGDQVLPGLQKRRNDEMALFNTSAALDVPLPNGKPEMNNQMIASGGDPEYGYPPVPQTNNQVVSNDSANQQFKFPEPEPWSPWNLIGGSAVGQTINQPSTNTTTSSVPAPAPDFNEEEYLKAIGENSSFDYGIKGTRDDILFDAYEKGLLTEETGNAEAALEFLKGKIKEDVGILETLKHTNVGGKNNEIIAKVRKTIKDKEDQIAKQESKIEGIKINKEWIESGIIEKKRLEKEKARLENSIDGSETESELNKIEGQIDKVEGEINEIDVDDGDLNNVQGADELNTLLEIGKNNKTIEDIANDVASTAKIAQIEKKGKEADPTLVQSAMDSFKNVLGSMIDGDELARMALMYVGSRALGYDHGGSIDWAAKSYLKRVDSQRAERQKWIMSKDARATYELSSLKDFLRTGDTDDLIEKGVSLDVKKQTDQHLYQHSGNNPGAKLTINEMSNGKHMVFLDGQYRSLGSKYVLDNTQAWSNDEHSTRANRTAFKGAADEWFEELNKDAEGGIIKAGTEKWVNKQITSDKATEANNIFQSEVAKWGNSARARGVIRQQVEESMADYFRDLQAYQQDRSKKEPKSIEQYYLSKKIENATDGFINRSYLEGTDGEKLQILNQKMVNFAVSASQNDDRTGAQILEDTWKDLRRVWDEYQKFDPKKKSEFTKQGIKGWNDFTSWMNLVMDNNPKAREVIRQVNKGA